MIPPDFIGESHRYTRARSRCAREIEKIVRRQLAPSFFERQRETRTQKLYKILEAMRARLEAVPLVVEVDCAEDLYEHRMLGVAITRLFCALSTHGHAALVSARRARGIPEGIHPATAVVYPGLREQEAAPFSAHLIENIVTSHDRASAVAWWRERGATSPEQHRLAVVSAPIDGRRTL